MLAALFQRQAAASVAPSRRTHATAAAAKATAAAAPPVRGRRTLAPAPAAPLPPPASAGAAARTTRSTRSSRDIAAVAAAATAVAAAPPAEQPKRRGRVTKQQPAEPPAQQPPRQKQAAQRGKKEEEEEDLDEDLPEELPSLSASQQLWIESLINTTFVVPQPPNAAAAAVSNVATGAEAAGATGDKGGYRIKPDNHGVFAAALRLIVRLPRQRARARSAGRADGGGGGKRMPVASVTPFASALPYLGDAVLGLAMTDVLHVRLPNVPAKRWADLLITMQRNDVLAARARQLGVVGQLVLLDDQREVHRAVADWNAVPKNGAAEDRMLSNVLEALVACFYLDGGLAAVTRFVQQQLLPGAFSASDAWAQLPLAQARNAVDDLSCQLLAKPPLYQIVQTPNGAVVRILIDDVVIYVSPPVTDAADEAQLIDRACQSFMRSFWLTTSAETPRAAREEASGV